MLPEGAAELPAFARFARAMLRSRDIDPLYPVLRHMIAMMNREQQFWFTFLYVAWYNLPSGYTVFLQHHTPLEPPQEPKPHTVYRQSPLAIYPTGIERRAHRGGKVLDHIWSYCDVVRKQYGRKQTAFYTDGLGDDPIENWRLLTERLQTLWGNGRWAAYKHCEILMKVHDLPLAAPDMGNQFSSGPREGLAFFYDVPEGQDAATIRLLDRMGLHLQRLLRREYGVDLAIEELETILCNWKSLKKGKYYVGHDIDEFQEQIAKGDHDGWLPVRARESLYHARRVALPHHYVGELHTPGWCGVDARRMTAYRDRGRIVVRRKS